MNHKKYICECTIIYPFLIDCKSVSHYESFLTPPYKQLQEATDLGRGREVQTKETNKQTNKKKDTEGDAEMKRKIRTAGNN